ncbi:hypothetical protein PQE66_gp150 [Bacillus phage PBC2]|uniref:Uncharacterized protein n=1 Tax=Bacillus phage PBC2 TaxID=1675029 RepID=A0A218KC32_9CAUD|nr:hypothetical protein PQE66_gp150 [Bacillus phage PBC2]AKQ08465.1 hypothetical protein PBC2_150 [Bacillus phage PBC2]
MFGFKKKMECGRCGSSKVVHTEITFTLGGAIDLHYCQKCVNDKAQELVEQHEENERKRKEAEAEKAKNDYYLWLKREVEIKELEEKAKEYGIDTKGGT